MTGKVFCLHGLLFAAAALTSVSLQAAPPAPDHVVIVIEENHSFDQVMGSPNAPYLNSLAADGMTFTNFFAITHPSQPNYLQLFSGSNQGIFDNTTPAPGTPFSTPNLGAELIGAGHTFGGYSEDLPAVGSTVSNSGNYARRHNPWVNWQSNSPGPNQLAPAVNMRFSDFPADFNLLPKVSVVVPNVQNDMHDGTIKQGDDWLVAHIKPYAQWAQANNSLLIVTFDEDESASRNRIPVVFSGPMVTQGTNDVTWTLHNLLRTVEDMYGTAHAGSAQQVRSIVGAFTSDEQIATKTFRQGLNGYSQAQDTYIEQASPNANRSATTPLVVDGSPLSQGLIRFDDIIGAAADQVPEGATILSAKLKILTGPNAGDLSTDTLSLHRMLIDWDDTDTWNSLGSGVSINDSEAASTPDFGLIPNILNAYAIFDVTSAIQAWSDQPADNFGWLIRDTSGTDGWRLLSSEFATLADRPTLEITYSVPEPAGLSLLAAAFFLLRRHRGSSAP